MSAFSRLYYRGAGESGLRRYKLLAKSWHRRTLGRRTDYYFWLILTLGLVAAFEFTAPKWRFGEGLVVGMLGTAFVLLDDLLLPDHIARWQRGAWGEQQTALVLKHLRKQEWLVRHDLASGYKNANRDHILAGPAVYLLDSKLLRDDVWVDDSGLHVRRVDETREEYVIPDLSRRMQASAKSLERHIERSVGFPVAVYPVVVIWGYFAAGVTWDGSVAYVDGERLLDWLRSRPADLLTEEKRQAVRRWLQGISSA